MERQHSKIGLGLTNAQLVKTSGYLSQANTIAQNLGAKPTNETLNSVSQVAGLVSQLPIPGVNVVAGVVAVAAQLLSSVFGGGPSTADQLRDMRTGNDILRSQIKTIDDQTAKINVALQSMQAALRQNGLAGWAEEMISLKFETDATAPLQQQLATKGRNLQVLIEIFNQTIRQTDDAIYGKKRAQNIVFYSLLALGVGSIIWYFMPEKANPN